MLLETVITDLSTAEQDALLQHEAIIGRGLQTFYEVGNALAAINTARLYRAEYRTFEAYCDQRWGLKRQRAYEYIEAAAVVANLSEISDTLPQKESHAAPLAVLPIEQQADAWNDAVATAETEGRPVAGRDVKAAVVRVQRVEVTTGTTEKKRGGNDQWFTPPKHIEPARYVFPTIDLDPASCVLAQRTVQATTYYTEETNGLVQPWRGCVWLNPPYSNPKPWIQRLVEFHTSGDVEAAIVLVNLVSSPAWARLLWPVATVVCLVSERIAFLQPDGTPVDNNDRDSMIALVCRPDDTARLDRFREVYSPFGLIR